MLLQHQLGHLLLLGKKLMAITAAVHHLSLCLPAAPCASGACCTDLESAVRPTETAASNSCAAHLQAAIQRIYQRQQSYILCLVSTCCQAIIA
jgi:hypothetical protein